MKIIRLILADGHDLARDGLCSILKRDKGIECVATAANGEEAIRVVKEFHPDVAIIDIALPEMNGSEVTKQIKKIRPETAVLIVSAYGYKSHVFACIEGGANGYLLKTVDYTTLINAIRLVNRGGFVLGREVAGSITNNRNIRAIRKADLGKLSHREVDVIKLVAKRLSNKQIARQLYISEQTVGSHVGNIFKKFDVHSRAQATNCAIKEGTLTLEDFG